MTTYILQAPRGAGKTRNAQKLADSLNTSGIVEEWDGESALPHACLALTNRYEITPPPGALVFRADDEAGISALVSLLSASPLPARQAA